MELGVESTNRAWVTGSPRTGGFLPAKSSQGWESGVPKLDIGRGQSGSESEKENIKYK